MQRLLEGSGVLGRDVGCDDLGSLKSALEYIAIDKRCSLTSALIAYNEARAKEHLPAVKARFSVTFDVGSLAATEAQTAATSPTRALTNVISRQLQSLPVHMRRIGLFVEKAKRSSSTRVRMLLD